MGEMEEALQQLEDRLDADEEDELYCVACNKEMRNEKAFATHRLQRYEDLRLNVFKFQGKCEVIDCPWSYYCFKISIFE